MSSLKASQFVCQFSDLEIAGSLLAKVNDRAITHTAHTLTVQRKWSPQKSDNRDDKMRCRTSEKKSDLLQVSAALQLGVASS